MRPEELYLLDIIEAANAIDRFIQATEKADFIGNDLLRSAVLQKLSIIGEAAAKLPKDFRMRHNVVPWADIVGFRNIAIHAYFAIDWSIVWITATRDVPLLKKMVADILAADFPASK